MILYTYNVADIYTGNMALNIHTDRQFEKHLEWLSKQLGKTKTDVIKDLVREKYHFKKLGFKFGALAGKNARSSKDIQKDLKKMDPDHDLD